ncbi:MAG: hypothetical protein V4449_03960 [Patescibacteria group bacterium]
MRLNAGPSCPDYSKYIDGCYPPDSLIGLEIQLYRFDKAGKYNDGGRMLQKILDLLGVHTERAGGIQ